MERVVEVVARPAATVVVAHEADGHLEVLLLRRPESARFAPGAHAFPGGAIEAEDASPKWAERLPEVGERTACVAALRELFEETGLMPATVGARGGVSARACLAAARQALLAGRARFSGIAERLALDFSAAALVYFARWITPVGLPLRFDTRFFLLGLDGRPEVAGLTSEHESACWMSPAEALRRFAAGDLPMLFPTAKTLERLAGFASVGEALSALREARVEPALVKLRPGETGLRPVGPGEPGYEEVP